MGVITETDIDYGRIFGPFPAVGHIPSSHFIGLLTADEHSETSSIKVNLNDSSLGNIWLPYIQPARTIDEQNVEAYTKDGHIYYRTLRIIKSEEEMYVWYSRDFAQILDLPDIKRCQNEDDNTFLVCDLCGEKFQYLFCMRAHARFRCTRTFKRKQDLGDNEVTQNKQFADLDKNTTELKFQNIRNNSDALKLKRTIDTDECTTVIKKKSTVTKREENNNNKDQLDLSPVTQNDKDPKNVVSAFRKVEKSFTGEIEKDPNIVISMTKNIFNINEPKLGLNKREEMINQEYYNKSVLQRNTFLQSRQEMILPNWIVPTQPPVKSDGDRAFYGDRLSVSSAATMQLSNQMTGIGRDVSRNIRNSDMLSKQILMEQLRKTQYPYIQSANPMVEKILTMTSPPVMLQRPVQPVSMAQNWCAKCNATFRMTSDLVYHMRSHHKREFDPVKRKREDKLQCHVCKETFKERHHLTRHMSSHS